MKKGALRNFAKFTGKHLCQSLFFNKVAGAASEIQRQKHPLEKCSAVLTKVFFKNPLLMYKYSDFDHIEHLCFNQCSAHNIDRFWSEVTHTPLQYWNGNLCKRIILRKCFSLHITLKFCQRLIYN